MRLSFHGAAGGVTGSCHLVECAGVKILLDCGLFQGSHEIEQENTEPLGFDPREIDFLLLSHAHLDHCGRIPLLERQGFKGEIITTAPTRALARITLMDAAYLQEEEAERRMRRRRKRSQHKQEENVDGPLYSELDALNSFERFGRTAVYGKPIQIAPGVSTTFGNAGHILGSAWIFLDLEENGKRRRLLFSGDLGNSGRPVLPEPDRPPKTDYLLLETTYGDRRHRSFEASVDELYGAINLTMEKGGNAIIPTFALDRAQELLYIIHEGERSGQLPAHLRVFLDSPMAIAATDVYSRFPELYRPNLQALFKKGRDAFSPSGLSMTRETAESMNLNKVSGAVILAGSGMCTGGRVRHHLVQNVARADSSLIFVGYAAMGTPARRIIDGAKTISLFGDELPVNADIYTINGFSAHADQAELLEWQASSNPKHIFLVHGEEKPMETIATKLNAKDVRTPKLHETIEL